MSSFMAPPDRYGVVESNDLVGAFPKPELRTRFRWRAERRARKLNGQRIIASYHWRAVRRGRRWEVWAYQNYLVPTS